ncbi:MAG: hypothetical protein EOO30_11470 [Comamonadaceae bacterium]|nr:MAG: hypothetical protein EOO30_11470 [Comamonadaceae bacterium]
MRRRLLSPLRRESLAVLVVVAAFQLAPAPANAADAWFLMGRHGECAPVEMLHRKFPDLGQVADPDTFLRFAAAKGLAVHSRPLALAGGSAVEVRIPDQGLALLFVTGGPCAGGAAARHRNEGAR